MKYTTEEVITIRLRELVHPIMLAQEAITFCEHEEHREGPSKVRDLLIRSMSKAAAEYPKLLQAATDGKIEAVAGAIETMIEDIGVELPDAIAWDAGLEIPDGI